ncbi:MAG: Hsp20/alpha crystallin family protein [Lachnospiraceae bacterium]|nr:Hsp20/alpha crystallin family protein [Lachnospiraceae bacterium]
MYMPSIFNDTFFDDFWGLPTEKAQPRRQQNAVMRTDVKETEDSYLLEMELPGFSKEELSVKLEDGCLTVSASHAVNSDNSETQTKDRYVRRERFLGTYARRFSVGKYLQQEDIKARFDNGVLTLSFPKEDTRKIEEAKYIAIE